MSTDATYRTTLPAGEWIAPGRRLRVEKPRKSSTSDDGEDDLRERRHRKTSPRTACRFGTASVPRRDGLLPDTGYAAQVIAQALQAKDLRRATYGAAPRNVPALFVDFRL